MYIGQCQPGVFSHYLIGAFAQAVVPNGHMLNFDAVAGYMRLPSANIRFHGDMFRQAGAGITSGFNIASFHYATVAHFVCTRNYSWNAIDNLSMAKEQRR
jgi:hypothetical protein